MMDALSKPLAFLRERRNTPLQRLLAAFGDRMPKGLYARALIIIIAPMVLLQSVLTFVFLERHWQTVTHRLSTAPVQNITMLIEPYQTNPLDAETFSRITEQNLGLRSYIFTVSNSHHVLPRP